MVYNNIDDAIDKALPKSQYITKWKKKNSEDTFKLYLDCQLSEGIKEYDFVQDYLRKNNISLDNIERKDKGIEYIRDIVIFSGEIKGRDAGLKYEISFTTHRRKKQEEISLFIKSENRYKDEASKILAVIKDYTGLYEKMLSDREKKALEEEKAELEPLPLTIEEKEEIPENESSHLSIQEKYSPKKDPFIITKD